MTLTIAAILLGLAVILVLSKLHYKFALLFGIICYLAGLFTSSSTIGRAVHDAIVRAFGG